MPWVRPMAKKPPSHRYHRPLPDQRDSAASVVPAGLFKDNSRLVQGFRLAHSIFDQPRIAILGQSRRFPPLAEKPEHRDETLTANRKIHRRPTRITHHHFSRG